MGMDFEENPFIMGVFQNLTCLSIRVFFSNLQNTHTGKEHPSPTSLEAGVPGVGHTLWLSFTMYNGGVRGGTMGVVHAPSYMCEMGAVRAPSKGPAAHCNAVHPRWDVLMPLRCNKIACNGLQRIFQYVGNFAPNFGISQLLIYKLSNGLQYSDGHSIGFPVICDPKLSI